ncbi:MAG: hypothetical protein R6X34_28165 [Chloroflexota bacterium]
MLSDEPEALLSLLAALLAALFAALLSLLVSAPASFFPAALGAWALLPRLSVT